MSEDEQIFKKTDKCEIKFDKGGNITIIGDCNGESIIRPEIAAFNKVSEIIEDEDEI
ncbi:hypothetical protein LCGC14_0797830 [marine sediment metagenome]|uniref:Uncharacterized protein n=1 Tax=marine sediment metagenome TaxID=412755 RepID=A0A0F9QAD0_9ZZZZ